MTITWYGQSCFKIQTKNNGSEITAILDPFSYEATGLRPPRGKADLVLVSHQHPDHNNISSFEDAFLIQGQGEYDVKGIAIKGIAAWHDAKKTEPVTIYKIDSENLKVCHLSDLGQDELTDEQIEKIGRVDILMIPVGGEYSLQNKKLTTLEAQSAQKIISQIEPELVIPMHYQIPGLKINEATSEKFLKAMGEAKLQPQEKLTIKEKDLVEEETKIVLLQAGS